MKSSSLISVMSLFWRSMIMVSPAIFSGTEIRPVCERHTWLELWSKHMYHTLLWWKTHRWSDKSHSIYCWPTPCDMLPGNVMCVKCIIRTRLFLITRFRLFWCFLLSSRPNTSLFSPQTLQMKAGGSGCSEQSEPPAFWDEGHPDAHCFSLGGGAQPRPVGSRIQSGGSWFLFSPWSEHCNTLGEQWHPGGQSSSS